MAHQGFTEYQNETVDRALGDPLAIPWCSSLSRSFDAEVEEVLDLRKVEQGELFDNQGKATC